MEYKDPTTYHATVNH